MADRVTAERFADAMPDQDPVLSPEEAEALAEMAPTDEALAAIAAQEAREVRVVTLRFVR